MIVDPYDFYDLKTVEEALAIVNSHRKISDMNGEPIDVSRYNIWTALKIKLDEIKIMLEKEPKE